MVSLNGDKHPVSKKSVLQKKTDILLLIPILTLGVLVETVLKPENSNSNWTYYSWTCWLDAQPKL